MASETSTTLRIPDLLKIEDWPWALKINPAYSDQLRDEEISYICGLPEVRESQLLQFMVKKALVRE